MATQAKQQKKQPQHGQKRAVLYVRVSSERQGERVSPEAQEDDARALCERQGYQIVAVYRDIEKYRIGKRLVEPSGTRADRPGLRAMLAAARRDEFDVLIAWREDRLYRSYRPMLDVLDTIEETGIDVELVKETFDKNLAPVKAWAAKMELDAKHDRFLMGVGGRYAKGKDWNGRTPYGYKRDENGFYQLHDDEARAVQIAWAMFGAGETLPTIRARLIAEGLPQRNTEKHIWAVSQIYHKFQLDYYWSGIIERTWNGATYQISMPIIVDAETAQRVKDRLARFKSYPAGNLKANALAAGLVYCEHCDNVMQVIQSKQRHKDYLYYRCPSKQLVGSYPQACARQADIHKIDADIWSKAWAFVSNRDEFLAEVDKRIAVLQQQQLEATGEIERLTRQGDSLIMERQWVITQARKNTISEEDMTMQLTALTFQESALRAELAKAQGLSSDRAERLRQIADEFLQRIAVGRKLVDLERDHPEQLTPEQIDRLFQFKREVIREIVKRVDVAFDKTTSVKIEIRLDNSPDQSVADPLAANCHAYMLLAPM
jgi:DNA invertase Pin-like site-specific DNA recombinase